MSASEYTEIAERFRKDTADHKMTVLHDDGMFRHIRFEAPTGEYFSLTTWPEKLVINGSVGTYVFSRMADMFEFGRLSRWNDGPNFGYWEEKVVASGAPPIDFSPAKFDKAVAEYLAEAEKDWPGVTAAWGEEVNGFLAEYDTSYEEGARFAVHDFTYQPEGADPADEPFQFYDTSDWDLKDFDWKFLWCCHAISWGIGEYDAARTREAVAS
ncbi:hypothetical protein [Actinomadura luteofluorescens]|uniref:hypothetical protein n=1 Tax=Actinomadura luteofluorescens TaxID=46163 RepID=UPI003D8B5491